MRIDNFSGKELKKVFDVLIDGDAKVVTDIGRATGHWHRSTISNRYPATGGLDFKALHTKIHQIKSWIRTTYPWVSDFNVDRYFDDFIPFRIQFENIALFLLKKPPPLEVVMFFWLCLIFAT